MPDLIAKIKELYSAFSRGDIQTILDNVTDDVDFESAAPPELAWGGNWHGKTEAAGYFSALASEHADPMLTMTEFFSTNDAVAAFGHYDATVRSTGVRVSTPVAHYFKFRNGKIAHYLGLTDSAAFVEAARKREPQAKIA
jgi:uncharacterized protein